LHPAFGTWHSPLGTFTADWAHQPGILIIDLPASAADPDATVIKVELDGPIQLVDAS
jgi:hypothetical protein